MGKLLLCVLWLGRAARICNSLLRQPADSLERQALVASVQLAAEQWLRVQPDPWGPWAAQLAAAIKAVGVVFECAQLRPLCPHTLRQAALERQLQRVADATTHGGHTKLQHYANVRSGSLTADSYDPEAFLDEVRTIALQQVLVHVWAGSHCDEEEGNRHKKLACTERQCPRIVHAWAVPVASTHSSTCSPSSSLDLPALLP